MAKPEVAVVVHKPTKTDTSYVFDCDVSPGWRTRNHKFGSSLVGVHAANRGASLAHGASTVINPALKGRGLEYGKLVLDQSEAWTSKTVSWTGEINATLGGARTVRSAKTGESMDRDYNGARGIFLRALGDQPILQGNLLDASAPVTALVASGSEK